MAADLPGLRGDLADERASLRGLVGTGQLGIPTPADGWDVRDTVSHLAFIDAEARLAAADPERFRAGLPAVAGDVGGFLGGQVERGRGMPGEDLLALWDSGFEELLMVLSSLDPAARVPWYGPPMSPASFVTARLMEYWAHGQDVADGLGVTRPSTGRLWHIVRLGVLTRGFSYANRGLPVPEGEVAVELTGPGGDTWAFGDGPDRVTGPALDFCLLVTQRRHRDDLSLVASGPLADDWLRIAQCFAGPPGPGRAPAAS